MVCFFLAVFVCCFSSLSRNPADVDGNADDFPCCTAVVIRSASVVVCLAVDAVGVDVDDIDTVDYG